MTPVWRHELNEIRKHSYASLNRIKTSVIWKHASEIYTCYRLRWNYITLSWNWNVRFFSVAETSSTWQGEAARFPDALKSNSLQPNKLMPSTKFAVSTRGTGNQNPVDAALQMTVPQLDTQTSAHEIKRPLARTQFFAKRRGNRKKQSLEIRNTISKDAWATLRVIRGKDEVHEGLSDSSLWAAYAMIHAILTSYYLLTVRLLE
jgi:hypothetical protein